MRRRMKKNEKVRGATKKEKKKQKFRGGIEMVVLPYLSEGTLLLWGFCRTSEPSEPSVLTAAGLIGHYQKRSLPKKQKEP